MPAFAEAGSMPIHAASVWHTLFKMHTSAMVGREERKSGQKVP